MLIECVDRMCVDRVYGLTGCVLKEQEERMYQTKLSWQ